MSEIVVVGLGFALAMFGYGAGRLHAQFSYRVGYRVGYRQGYFDGDRSSWSRRRRDLQAAVASVLQTPPTMRGEAYAPSRPHGTTYTTSSTRPSDDTDPLAARQHSGWLRVWRSSSERRVRSGRGDDRLE
jgi:hypothetical protein